MAEDRRSHDAHVTDAAQYAAELVAFGVELADLITGNGEVGAQAGAGYRLALRGVTSVVSLE